VPLAGGGAVLVIRVPKSPLPPHRIGFKNSHRIWARSSAGKFEPSIEELRQIFSAGPQRLEQIRAFHAERVRLIGSGATPAPLFSDRALLVLHVVPYAAFDPGHIISGAELAEKDRDFRPIEGGSRHWYPDFDGFVGLSNADADPNAEQRAYVQVLWSGAVESVAALSEFDIEILRLERSIVRSAAWYAHSLNGCGIPPPYAVLLSLIKAKGASFITEQSGTPVVSVRDRYRFPDVLLSTVPEEGKEAAPSLRPILDRLATLAGESHTPTFDSQGNYRLVIGPPDM
jgi:hypothetical protein